MKRRSIIVSAALASTLGALTQALPVQAGDKKPVDQITCEDFLKMALEGKSAVPFRVPTGLKLVRIDPRTGMRAGGGEGRQILEAYKPGTSHRHGRADGGRWTLLWRDARRRSHDPLRRHGRLVLSDRDRGLAGPYFTRSHTIRRTLNLPSSGSGDGGGDRCSRSPSRRTFRVWSEPVQGSFQDTSTWCVTTLPLIE